MYVNNNIGAMKYFKPMIDRDLFFVPYILHVFRVDQTLEWINKSYIFSFKIIRIRKNAASLRFLCQVLPACISNTWRMRIVRLIYLSTKIKCTLSERNIIKPCSSSKKVTFSHYLKQKSYKKIDVYIMKVMQKYTQNHLHTAFIIRSS